MRIVIIKRKLISDLAVVGILVALAGCGSHATTSPGPSHVSSGTASTSTSTPAAGRIAYPLAKEGGVPLWVIDADGTNKHILARADAGNGYQWSPDGSRIAVASGFGPAGTLTLIAASGIDMRLLASVRGVGVAGPAWSPDGGSIAVSLIDASGGSSIAVVNARTGVARVLAHAAGRPVWLPDGKRLGSEWVAAAKDSEPPAGVGLLVVPAVGGRTTRLAAVGSKPAWAPDGSAVAFSGLAQGGSTLNGPFSVYLASADGTARREVEREGGEYGWAPDSAHLAIITGRQGLIVVARGSARRKALPVGRGQIVHCFTWSVDSTQIAFTGTDGLWLIRIDGSKPRQILKNSPDGTSSPGCPISWQPGKGQPRG